MSGVAGGSGLLLFLADGHKGHIALGSGISGLGGDGLPDDGGESPDPGGLTEYPRTAFRVVDVVLLGRDGHFGEDVDRSALGGGPGEDEVGEFQVVGLGVVDAAVLGCVGDQVAHEVAGSGSGLVYDPGVQDFQVLADPPWGESCGLAFVVGRR